MNTLPAYLGARPEDYARLHLKKTQVEGWEDGMRTDGSAGTYEWWYFDVHLTDGSTLVITFLTKNYTDVDRPLTPLILYNLDRPDGTVIEKVHYLPVDQFSASKEGCDVRIEKNTFAGDLHTYTIHVEIDEILTDITLTGTSPAWRPETGYLFFGEQAENFFAWLPSVPQGNVEAAITVNGKRDSLTGIGYHDHNWGNISILKLVNHWYWARGKVGDYTIIVADITTEKVYGYKTFPVFMLARDGKIVADDGDKVRFEVGDVQIDAETRKPFANVTIYDYQAADQHYRLTFTREKTILRTILANTLVWYKRLLAKLIGFDGAYLRFTGQLTIDRFEDGKVASSEKDTALWELMYFGHVPKT